MASLPDDDRYVQDKKPVGLRLFEYIKEAPISLMAHQAIVLIVTFFAYASFRATREAVSVLKSTLDPQSSVTGGVTGGSGWAPFNGSNGSSMLGEMDVAFLSVYAIGMYFSGQLADRMNLRTLLAAGMVGSGLFASLFGVAYWANIHNFYYFLVVQMLAGLFQSTGWPCIMTVVGNWFRNRNRGLIMGIWHANTSVGDIAGALTAAALLPYGWGWSILVQGLVMMFMGLVVLLILPVNHHASGARDDRDNDEVEQSLLTRDSAVNDEAVGFVEACCIPGVVPFAVCLFFEKLVSSTFLYWLPFYISRTAIAGQYLSSEEAGKLSTLFDLGGVVGGILAGHISDKHKAQATTTTTLVYCTIPALILYRSYGYISLTVNITLLFITGVFVYGADSLVTTVVSADLGNHECLKGNSRAVATVAAIINGTGSLGAALGPLLTGYISEKSWTAVFVMLMVSALVSGLLLTRLVVAEVAAKVEQWKSTRAATL